MKVELHPSLIFLRAKIKLSLCVTKHHAIKTYWRSGPLTSAADGEVNGELHSTFALPPGTQPPVPTG